MNRLTIPWIIATLLGMYVFGLSYHAKHRPPPDPAYEFYDTTVVRVFVEGFAELPDVYGRFNNIVEGERQLIEAQPDNAGYFELAFRVNSPRPALLYIDDEVMEVFLVPDSTLTLSVFLNTSNFRPDSVAFEGYTAGICDYYQKKSRYFREVQSLRSRNTLNSEDFAAFSAQLDAMAMESLDFLTRYDMQHQLPNWFFDFERSEILYQKAYLKLSNAYNRPIEPQYLDEVALNNEQAVFSYYYYLYLKAYIAARPELQEPGGQSMDQQEARLRAQMNMADTLLQGEMHDVFLTRMIFNQLKREQLQLVESLLDTYRGKFNRKKYERFLMTQFRLKTAKAS